MTFNGTKEEIQQYIYRNLEKNVVYDIKMDKHRNKRSLDANSYAWHLISEISNALRSSKEEIYLQMLKDYGQREYCSLLASVKPERISKYYDLQGTFKHGNNTFNSYMFYVGTSQYNSKEMSIFIDGVVQECRNLGIQTKEDYEIEQMIKEMEKNESSNINR